MGEMRHFSKKPSFFFFTHKSCHHSGFNSNRPGLERKMFGGNLTPPPRPFESFTGATTTGFFKSLLNVPFFFFSKKSMPSLKNNSHVKAFSVSQPVF